MPTSTIARTLTLLGSLVFCLAAHAQPIRPQIEISPRLPSSVDSLRIRLSGYSESAVPPSFAPPTVVGNQIILRTDSPLRASNFGWTEDFSLSPLSAGNYTLEVVAGGAVLSTLAFNVRAQTTGLLLIQRFGVQASQDPGSNFADAVQLSDESGYFWFFDSSNPEVTVKILDGRLVNGYYWVFIASMTDVPFTVVIAGPDFDCPLPNPFFCRDTRIYKSPAGKNMNFIDLAAFQD